MIWRIISNVWYSININGTRYDFFNSTRGLRQGDPLSSSLFLIGVELLTKLLDSLNQFDFIPYSIDINSPTISHLCYAEDTILFSSGDPNSLKIMMEKLDIHEEVSGQAVNKAK